MRFFLFISFLLSITSSSAQLVDTLDYALGKVEYSKHSEFVKIADEHARRSGMYLRKEALESFILMKQAAISDGVELKIISAARSFSHQKRIWEAKWNGKRLVNGKNLKTTITDTEKRAKEILKYSSMPGTSRHHWGTDIDINSLNPKYFETGKGKKEYDWLCLNAHKYGFCQVYSIKGSSRPTGYEEEKWHWSYLPIASKLLKFYAENVTGVSISGFDGSKALPFDEISKYVFGIAEDCK